VTYSVRMYLSGGLLDDHGCVAALPEPQPHQGQPSLQTVHPPDTGRLQEEVQEGERKGREPGRGEEVRKE